MSVESDQATHEARVTDPATSLEDRQVSVAWLLENHQFDCLPHTLITDRDSILGYRDLGYTFREARPYWPVYAPDGSLYALADRATCEAWL